MSICLVSINNLDLVANSDHLNPPYPFSTSIWEAGMTHIGGLFVVVYVVHVSGQTKVSNFHHIILRHQNIPGCQVSMDTLNTQKRRSTQLITCQPQTSFNLCERNLSNSKSSLQLSACHFFSSFLARCYFHGQKATHLHWRGGVVAKGCEILSANTVVFSNPHGFRICTNVSGHGYFI